MKFLSLKEAAAFLKVSASTLYHLVSDRKIKFYKKGQKLYFLESDLVDHILSGNQNTSSYADKAEVEYGKSI